MSVSKPGFHTHSVDSDDDSISQNPLLYAALLGDAVADDDSVATASSRPVATARSRHVATASSRHVDTASSKHAHFEAGGRGAQDGSRHRDNSSSTDDNGNYHSPPLPRGSSQRMHVAHGYRLNSDSDRYAPCSADEAVRLWHVRYRYVLHKLLDFSTSISICTLTLSPTHAPHRTQCGLEHAPI